VSNGLFDLRSIFKDMLPPDQQMRKMEAEEIAKASNPMAAMAGSSIARLKQRLPARAFQLTGDRGMLSGQQNMARELRDIRPDDPDIFNKSLEAAKKYMPEKIPDLMAAEEARKQQVKAEEAARQAAALEESKIQSEIAENAAQTRYYDAQAGKENAEQLKLQNASAYSLDLSTLDPDNYDQGSIYRAQQLEAEAGNDPEKLRKARTALLPKAQDGYIWRKKPGETDAYGNDLYLEYPTGGKKAELSRDVDMLNGRLEQQKAIGERNVEKIDSMLSRLESGEVQAGNFEGIVLSYIPTTGEYEFSGDIEVLKANLGYNALMEAKENSPTGASGFGQLSNYEMMLLQSLFEDLSPGTKLSKETLENRLKSIRDVFADAASRSRSYTLDEYIGWTEYEEPEVQDAFNRPSNEEDALNEELRRRGLIQ